MDNLVLGNCLSTNSVDDVPVLTQGVLLAYKGND